MPNIRMILWVALGVALFYNYEAWMHDYPSTPVSLTTANAQSTNVLGNSVPKASDTASTATIATTTSTIAFSTAAPLSTTTPLGATVPSATLAVTKPDATAASGVAPASTSAPASTPAIIAPATHLQVRTDVLQVSINLQGGELDQADLLQYPLRKDAPNIPVRLLNHGDAAATYLLQTGLISGDAATAPTHLVTWSAAAPSYTLNPGLQEVHVPLTWTDGAGLVVTKTFVFTRGSYAINLIYDVRNDGTTVRKLAAYSQFLRHWEPAKRSYFDVETYSFKGPAISDGSKSRDLKVDNDEDSKYSQIVTNGWLASLQHHFVAAIVPASNQPFKYLLQVQGSEYLLSATGPITEVAAGAKAQFQEKLFIGPKLQAQLSATGPDLDRTVDYGKLTVLAKPLFTLLHWVHGLIGNWGWAIIIVTALIKLAFYPLSQASGRSMAKMRAVAPRMKQIQETYKDDREKLGRAMMDLYKKEKINPLAGCLPMVVQIPFFISFYWVLLESVEMRQAPFMLWVNDLSSRDPYFILPFFMGAAMFAQFKLNPAPPDPMQAKIMQFMPVVMTVMMAWFPSGLVLYWLTNTVLSILQQWRVNQVVEAAAAAAKIRN